MKIFRNNMSSALLHIDLWLLLLEEVIIKRQVEELHNKRLRPVFKIFGTNTISKNTPGTDQALQLCKTHSGRAKETIGIFPHVGKLQRKRKL